MTRTHFAIASLLACLLAIASLCQAQSAAASQAADPNQANSSSQTAPAASQTTPAPAQQTTGQQQADENQNRNQRPTNSAETSSPPSGTSNDRLFFALPNFLTLENAGNVPPLTTRQKFGVVARGSFDPIQIPWYGALSGISQAENSEPGFGQGAQGYGKRYGAYAADGTIENFFVGAIFPTILRQDPRYFQKEQGSFFSRTGYAVSRIFWTRTDSGHGQFNYSEIVGAAVASVISTYSYHPHPPYQQRPYIASDRTWKNAASVWWTQVGYDTLTLGIKEFWPDIRRRILKNHHRRETTE